MSRLNTIVTEEETTLKKTIFETNYFKIKWSTKQMSKFSEKIQKLIESRKEHSSKMYQEIMNRMKYQKGSESIALNKIDYIETVIAFSDQFIKRNKINTVPKQKTIAEAAIEKPFSKRAIKPLPRKKK